MSDVRIACFRIHDDDNVATLLSDSEPGEVPIIGDGDPPTAHLIEPIKNGHKVAVRAIAQGEAIMKYAVPIGHAKRDIAAGEWVHLHNIESAFDERSGTLDVNTGAPTDTSYDV